MTDEQYKVIEQLRRAVRRAQGVGLYLVAVGTESGTLRVITREQGEGPVNLNNVEGEDIRLDNACGFADTVNLEMSGGG